MSIQLVNVGVAQVKLGTTDQVLRTILGSCVGICIYDRQKKIGGLAHILLPEGTEMQNQPEKFAKTAVPFLINMLIKQGCTREFMSAKIAGGASMFKFKANTPLGQIGEKNIEMTKQMLIERNIPLLEKDVGGNSGRVIDFFLNDGHLKIKADGQIQNYYKV